MYLGFNLLILLCSSSNGLRLATSYGGCSKSQIQCAVANETAKSLEVGNIEMAMAPAEGGQHYLCKSDN